MAQKTKEEILSLLKNFQKNILDKKPSLKQMYEEIRMMNFKIKPLQGDISILDLNNRRFIETLWRLGKLDEFFYNKVKKLKKADQKILFNYFDSLHFKLQEKLNQLNFKQAKLKETSPVIEMEIIKEHYQRKKLN
ncbi:MAG: hypothetical protein QHH09_00945 [Microgenomates group bacterium]|nr:hypothetical protein [Microgenomates group bacterium]